MVATIESLAKIKGGSLPSLSEQQLVDCSYDNGGCSGGDPGNAFQYVVQNGGVASEDAYPYTSGSQGGGGGYDYGGFNGGYNGYGSGCDSQKASDYAATISGYEQVQQSQDSLLEAVSQQPVASVVAVDGQEFMFYSGGVYNGACAESTNHVFTLVGYGTEDGSPYWLAKNSWGTSFGEEGYMKILRSPGDSESLCGVGTYALYPTA